MTSSTPSVDLGVRSWLESSGLGLSPVALAWIRICVLIFWIHASLCQIPVSCALWHAPVSGHTARGVSFAEVCVHMGGWTSWLVRNGVRESTQRCRCWLARPLIRIRGVGPSCAVGGCRGWSCPKYHVSYAVSSRWDALGCPLWVAEKGGARAGLEELVIAVGEQSRRATCGCPWRA